MTTGPQPKAPKGFEFTVPIEGREGLMAEIRERMKPFAFVVLEEVKDDLLTLFVVPAKLEDAPAQAQVAERMAELQTSSQVQTSQYLTGKAAMEDDF